MCPQMIFGLAIFALLTLGGRVTAYTNQWAVHIEGGPEAAQRVAMDHGFQYLDKVPSQASLTLRHTRKPCLQFKKSLSEVNLPFDFLQRNLELQERQKLSTARILRGSLPVVCPSSRRFSEYIADQKVPDRVIDSCGQCVNCYTDRKPPLKSFRKSSSKTVCSRKSVISTCFARPDATTKNDYETKIEDSQNYFQDLDVEYFQPRLITSLLNLSNSVRYYTQDVISRQFGSRSVKDPKQWERQSADCSGNENYAQGQKLPDHSNNVDHYPQQPESLKYDYNETSKSCNQQEHSSRQHRRQTEHNYDDSTRSSKHRKRIPRQRRHGHADDRDNESKHYSKEQEYEPHRQQSLQYKRDEPIEDSTYDESSKQLNHQGTNHEQQQHFQHQQYPHELEINEIPHQQEQQRHQQRQRHHDYQKKRLQQQEQKKQQQCRQQHPRGRKYQQQEQQQCDHQQTQHLPKQQEQEQCTHQQQQQEQQQCPQHQLHQQEQQYPPQRKQLQQQQKKQQQERHQYPHRQRRRHQQVQQYPPQRKQLQQQQEKQQQQQEKQQQRQEKQQQQQEKQQQQYPHHQQHQRQQVQLYPPQQKQLQQHQEQQQCTQHSHHQKPQQQPNEQLGQSCRHSDQRDQQHLATKCNNLSTSLNQQKHCPLGQQSARNRWKPRTTDSQQINVSCEQKSSHTTSNNIQSLPCAKQKSPKPSSRRQAASLRGKIARMCGFNSKKSSASDKEKPVTFKTSSLLPDGLISRMWKCKSSDTPKTNPTVSECGCCGSRSELAKKSQPPKLPVRPIRRDKKKRKVPRTEVFIPYRSSIKPKVKRRPPPKNIDVKSLIQDPEKCPRMRTETKPKTRGFNKEWQESSSSNPCIVRFNDNKNRWFKLPRGGKTGEEIRSEATFAVLGSSSYQKPPGTFKIDDVSDTKPNVSTLKYRLSKCPTVKEMWQHADCQLPKVQPKPFKLPQSVPVTRKKVAQFKASGELACQKYPIRLRIYKSKDSLDPSLPMMAEVSRDRSCVDTSMVKAPMFKYTKHDKRKMACPCSPPPREPQKNVPTLMKESSVKGQKLKKAKTCLPCPKSRKV